MGEAEQKRLDQAMADAERAWDYLVDATERVHKAYPKRSQEPRNFQTVLADLNEAGTALASAWEERQKAAAALR